MPNNAKLKITWLRNEASLEDFEDERIMTKNSGAHSSRLKISDLVYLDTGFYTCRAESEDGLYGTAESTMTLQVKAPPMGKFFSGYTYAHV